MIVVFVSIWTGIDFDNKMILIDAEDVKSIKCILESEIGILGFEFQPFKVSTNLFHQKLF